MKDTLPVYSSKKRLSLIPTRCRLERLWDPAEVAHDRPFFVGDGIKVLTGSIVLLKIPSQLYAISINKSIDIVLRYVLLILPQKKFIALFFLKSFKLHF